MRDQANRHERLGLAVAEAASYDAIVQATLQFWRW